MPNSDGLGLKRRALVPGCAVRPAQADPAPPWAAGPTTPRSEPETRRLTVMRRSTGCPMAPARRRVGRTGWTATVGGGVKARAPPLPTPSRTVLGSDLSDPRCGDAGQVLGRVVAVTAGCSGSRPRDGHRRAVAAVRATVHGLSAETRPLAEAPRPLAELMGGGSAGDRRRETPGDRAHEPQDLPQCGHGLARSRP